MPTIAYEVESFTKYNLNFTVFDMSGQGKFRDMWEKVLVESDGVIFVIDASDRVRMAVVRQELEDMLAFPNIQGAPILFFANKKDIPNALPAHECSEVLQLHQIKNNSWIIRETNALTGEGIEEGIKWLASELQKNMTNTNSKS
eukprot:CAMPEP_0117427306 /NCGR_PEP_ID=MMETSP0758-20121206/7182_1 /TAXON_ID=63605 /ORGANISM="Percolomonas cosmopolitus, Strain AE-1 (ATCC 50343)" /LENGTH=143 /DNA_ID=CAMNT_0005212867 /DNA_START=338 /DNA_END=769 /DNA_ORIENTATION=+